VDVIINEVTASIKLTDGRGMLDAETLAGIVRTVLEATRNAADTEARRRAETRIEDDGRGAFGLAGH
jgi:hypothetical protein